MVATENVGHRLGIQQCADRQFGVRQATLGVGVDDIAVAGVDNSTAIPWARPAMMLVAWPVCEARAVLFTGANRVEVK